jgi:NitT/TauT family transport system permease protein
VTGKRRQFVLRFVSLVAILVVWTVGSLVAGPRLLPSPVMVLATTLEEAGSGALLFNIAITLARVAIAFGIAMLAGTALGILMGRSRTADDLFDLPLIVLLNLPALVIVVLAYIWAGLTETAAILAVAINKFPNTAVTVREGTRALDRGLDEVAQVYRFDRAKRLRHVVLPQLAPFIAAAARSGLSLVWKIVLVVELLGRPNGVGFEIGTAFQLFDVARILAYALTFVVVIVAIEYLAMQPFERRVTRWRPHAA